MTPPLALHEPNTATPPLAYDAQALACALSVSLRTIRAMDVAGELPRPVRLRRRLVWAADEIRAWLAAGAPRRAEWESRPGKRA